MTFPRLRALEREWKRRPPLTWIVGAALGWKPPDEAAARGDAEAAQTRKASIAELDAMFPNGRFRGA